MNAGKAELLDKGVRSAANILLYVCCGALFLLMLIGTADVTGRYVFNRPVTGTLEASEILMATAVLLGLAYVQVNKANVRVTIVYDLCSPRLQTIMDFVVSILALALFGLVMWQGIEAVKSSWQAHRMIGIFGVPLFPFEALVPLGTLCLCLVLITQIVHYFTLLRERRS